jgi:ABC-type phosphate transport system substrate-binding protein
MGNLKPQELIRKCLALPWLLTVAMISTSAHADVVVIVSAKSHVTGIKAEQAARIFLGKTSTFPDNGDAVPIDQAEGSPIREEFYSKVVHKTSTQLAAYWAKIIFTGDGRPPEMLNGNAAVRKAVADNPNAIGYIDKSAVNKSVKVILAP